MSKAVKSLADILQVVKGNLKHEELILNEEEVKLLKEVNNNHISEGEFQYKIVKLCSSNKSDILEEKLNEGDFKSSYEYENCYCFINKFNIRNREVLTDVEKVLSARGNMKLVTNTVSGNFDLEHLCNIHKCLFGDVYTWAGELRKEEISKGTSLFAPTTYMSIGMENGIFIPLKHENYLRGLSNKEICGRLAHYYCELNFAHPFREGNGRTQREFIRQLAQYNNLELLWDKADKEVLLNATIEGTVGANIKQGKAELTEIISGCIIAT